MVRIGDVEQGQSLLENTEEENHDAFCRLAKKVICAMSIGSSLTLTAGFLALKFSKGNSDDQAAGNYLIAIGISGFAITLFTTLIALEHRYCHTRTMEARYLEYEALY